MCPQCHRPSVEPERGFRQRADDQGLTDREAQVIKLIGRGLTNREIVEELGLSANTIKSYIRTAYRRLDVASRSEAVIWANGFDVDRSEPS